MAQNKVADKLNSLFKEEVWGRIEPRDTGISKFKILEDLFDIIVTENMIDEAVKLCNEHLEEHPDSVTAAYLIGTVGYYQDDAQKSIHLRRLIETFIDSHKWAVVEVLSEKILEYGENSVALRALALSLERLGRNREAIPVLEDLLKIDRFDAEVARKLATALVSTDPEKSTYYMKLAIEGFIKNGRYEEVSAMWNKLLMNSVEDVAFFERIERQLVEAKQRDLAANLLKVLLNKYRDDENPDQSIQFLKKILQYRPDDHQARRDLIRLYEKKYSEHTQLQQFLKLSNLGDMNKPVKYAIQDFEKNIIFDKGNYAFHGSWGLGRIQDIDSDSLIIDFEEKAGHRMSIQMALQSLMAVEKDHFYVMQFEDPEGMKQLFKDDFIQFFTIIIKSFDGVLSLEDIKRELSPRYVDPKNWTKWWNRARTAIKKNPNFGISEKKKNTIYLREKPITLADELLEQFSKTDSFSGKLDSAIEFVNNAEEQDGAPVAQYFVDYFTEQTKGDSITRLVLSYFILSDFGRFIDPAKIKLDTIKPRVVSIIQLSSELPVLSRKISSYDYKKQLVQLIEESREDWPRIYYEILFEVPVRIHKHIMSRLISAHEYRVINDYIGRIITGYREFPDLFMWVSRNLLYASWNHDWLDYSRETLATSFFRFMNELKKVEKDGNRMKNLALEMITDNDGAMLGTIVSWVDQKILSRLYDILVHVSFTEELHHNLFLKKIQQQYPDFEISSATQSESDDMIQEKLMVTTSSFNAKKAQYDEMVNNELVNITRELSKVAETSGDMRENVDYTALMEKHNILELEISKLDEDLKKAEIIDPGTVDTASVSIGTSVTLSESSTGDKVTYAILGPWEADFEKNILSYRSPIAESLLGKNTGSEVVLIINDESRQFTIESVELCSIL